jgi:hypothetical protein
VSSSHRKIKPSSTNSVACQVSRFIDHSFFAVAIACLAISFALLPFPPSHTSLHPALALRTLLLDCCPINVADSAGTSRFSSRFPVVLLIFTNHSIYTILNNEQSSIQQSTQMHAVSARLLHHRRRPCRSSWLAKMACCVLTVWGVILPSLRTRLLETVYTTTNYQSRRKICL